MPTYCCQNHSPNNEFPVKVSHFTVISVTLLDSDPNVNKMHELFLEKHPDMVDDITMNTIGNIFGKSMDIGLASPK